jgi:acetyl-CoA carboxylase biotin carboxyl carrier protein
MDIEQLRELVQLMVENELSEVDIRDGEDRISLKRGPSGQVVMSPLTPPAGPQPPPSAPAPTSVEPPAAEPPPPDDQVAITSPMVGTFYSAPAPDSAPFVAVGDTVGEETVVCIVEAMKVMNEIKAECRGSITKILVENGDAVEYGQPLFMVRPG